MTVRIGSTPYSEDSARLLARTLGPSSSAAQALQEIELRRGRGEKVALYRFGSTFRVGQAISSTEITPAATRRRT